MGRMLGYQARPSSRISRAGLIAISVNVDAASSAGAFAQRVIARLVLSKKLVARIYSWT
jgi:hypothetical protein